MPGDVVLTHGGALRLVHAKERDPPTAGTGFDAGLKLRADRIHRNVNAQAGSLHHGREDILLPHVYRFSSPGPARHLQPERGEIGDDHTRPAGFENQPKQDSHRPRADDKCRLTRLGADLPGGADHAREDLRPHGIGQRDVIGDGEDVARRGDAVTGQTAVEEDTQRRPVFALVGPPHPAIAATAAGDIGRDRDTLTRHDVRDLSADGHHTPKELMPHDRAGRGRVAGRNIQDVQVGAADAAPFDLDQHVIGALDARHRPRLNFQFPLAAKHRGEHRVVQICASLCHCKPNFLDGSQQCPRR